MKWLIYIASAVTDKYVKDVALGTTNNSYAQPWVPNVENVDAKIILLRCVAQKLGHSTAYKQMKMTMYQRICLLGQSNEIKNPESGRSHFL